MAAKKSTKQVPMSKPASTSKSPVSGVESPVYNLDQGASLPPQTDNLNPDRAK